MCRFPVFFLSFFAGSGRARRAPCRKESDLKKDPNKVFDDFFWMGTLVDARAAVGGQNPAPLSIHGKPCIVGI